MRISRFLSGAAFGVACLTASAASQETTRVSLDSSGVEGDNYSVYPCMSGDGRYVAFDSQASNLVTGDTNGIVDVFVVDRSNGITERVSVGAGGEADSASHNASISADGRFVAFWSNATNLVAGDTNGIADVFVRDRSTGNTERVSVDSSGGEGNGPSNYPSISTDGRFVAFNSSASNLVAGDANGAMDVFVHDRTTGTTERLSVDSSGTEGNGLSTRVAISADGQVVVFDSQATNLVAGDTNGSLDVFVHDRSTGITERVSVDSSGAQGIGNSYVATLSADGQVVAFQSLAANLVFNDNNSCEDVFVHDRATGITQRISVSSTGGESNTNSRQPRISADGQTVVFDSDASNLVAGDTNAASDAFVHDLSTGSTERVSVDSSGAQGNSYSFHSSISSDGQFVVFQSNASNLVAGDTNGVYDIFVHERCTTDAAWTNYGAGFPGTNGVPSFTSQADPVLGTTITLDVANSRGAATNGLLFVGYQRASIHSALGGDLLLIPALTRPIGLLSGGASFTGAIPNDAQLCGFVIDLQVLESDPGAAKGVSFTAGLELLLGH